jgi:Flp pilus assembly protein protease CpaA
MLEEVIFGQLVMPGELVRIVIAFVGTALAAYYDLFNRKNVPNELLFAFVGIALIVDIIFYQQDLFWFSIGVAAFFSAIGYIFYRVGQLGGADVFVLAAVMLLLPVHPSFTAMPFNMPFVFSVFIFSGVLFALYVMAYFGWKLSQNPDTKPNLLYGLMLVPYALFAYVYVNSFIFSPVYFAFISLLLFATIFFMMFRESLNLLLAEELPLAQIQPEDVLALEVMNKDMLERYKIPRVVTAGELERLKRTKVTDLWVYTKLPPFLPFIFAGMVIAAFFARSLILA